MPADSGKVFATVTSDLVTWKEFADLNTTYSPNLNTGLYSFKFTFFFIVVRSADKKSAFNVSLVKSAFANLYKAVCSLAFVTPTLPTRSMYRPLSGIVRLCS